MANTLILKRSSVANAAPSTGNLVLGELAINTVDARLFTKIDTGSESVIDLTKTQATGDATGNRVTSTGELALTLANTGVTADTYGNAQAIPSITVDAKGRITSATTFAIDTSGVANGTSNIAIPVANGNINMSVDGNANILVVTGVGINVDGTAAITGNVTVGNILTDGYYYANGAPVDFQQPAGSNTEIQFNNDSDFGASANFTFDTATNVLTVTGNIDTGNLSTTGLIDSTGNITGGNLDTAGQVTATGNITGGNLDTAGQVTATGNITGGNLITSGTFESASITSTGNITGANIISTGLVTATGNVSGGNLTTAGAVDATGNITGGNLVTAGTANVGTLDVTNNATIGGNVNVDNIVGSGTNVTITAGSFTTTFDDTGNVAFPGNISVSAAGDFTGNVDAAGFTATNSISAGTTITATGNIDGGNVNSTSAVTAGTTVTATGNVSGGNLTTAGQVTATGNVSGGNLVTAGDVTTATVTASGNITGANLDVTSGITAGTTIVSTGNITGGNIGTSGQVTATGNVNGGNLVTTGNVDGGNINSAKLASSSDLQLVSTGGNILIDASGGVIDMGGLEVHNVGTPIDATDAATKQYVDDAVSTGITIHTPVRLESPDGAGSLNATYAQGGTTYTVNETIAGNTVVFSTAANLQVNDQLWFSTSFQGIVANVAYFVVSAPNTSAAVLSTTYSGVPVANITSASGLTESVRVNSGQGATLTNAGANAALVIDGVTVNTNDRVLIYNQSNGYENGVYDVTVAGDAGNAWVLTRSSDMNTYIPDNINGVDAGDYFFVQQGDSGAGESYVMTAPIGPLIIGFDTLTFSQFSASQVYTANTNAGLSLTGTVFAAKVDLDTTAFDLGGNIKVKDGANLVTPNIGDATGNSLTLTGNGAISAVTIVSTGNIDGGNLVTTGLVSATGNVSGGNITTGGQVVATGNITGGNLVTAGDVTTATVTASGNVSGGNLVTAGDVTTATVTASNTIEATGNITGGNLLTAGVITATGNITGGNLSGTNITGTLTTAAQPNITSIGNLAVANVGTLTVSTLANITATTAATSNVTGALTVSGGVGVGGDLWASDIYKNGVIVLNADDTIDGGTY